jgi:hypothetical protein
VQCRRDQIAHLIEGPWTRSAEKGFELRKRLLDRIEVGTVRREEAELRARRFNRPLHLRLFVHGEVVEHDHVARTQGGHKHLIDIGPEHHAVERSVKHGGRRETLESEPRDDGVRLPVAAGRVIMQPCAARAPAVASQQIGRHPTFIEKDILAHIAQWLPQLPLATGRRDISASLFVGVYRFF